jgi:hypothetical protein
MKPNNLEYKKTEKNGDLELNNSQMAILKKLTSIFLKIGNIFRNLALIEIATATIILSLLYFYYTKFPADEVFGKTKIIESIRIILFIQIFAFLSYYFITGITTFYTVITTLENLYYSCGNKIENSKNKMILELENHKKNLIIKLIISEISHAQTDEINPMHPNYAILTIGFILMAIILGCLSIIITYQITIFAFEIISQIKSLDL